MKGLVGGAAQGSATTALIPRSSGNGTLQSVPRRRGLLGVVEGTRQREARCGSKAAAEYHPAKMTTITVFLFSN